MGEYLAALLRAAAAEITVLALVFLGPVLFTIAKGRDPTEALTHVKDHVRQNPALIAVCGGLLGVVVRIGGVDASYGRYFVIFLMGVVVGLVLLLLIFWLAMRRFPGATWQGPADMPKDAKRYVTILTWVLCVGGGLLLAALGVRTD